MGIIARPRKDGTMGWQVIVRPSGGKTIVKTFDDRESADMFEQVLEQDMKATRLRKALAARVSKGAQACAVRTEVVEEWPTPQAAQQTFDDELVVDTLHNYMKSSECRGKSRVAIPSIMRTLGNLRLSQLKKRWVRQYIDDLRARPTQFGKPYAYSTIQGYISVINCAARWRAEEFDLAPVRIPFDKRNMLPRNYSNERSRRLARDEEVALFGALRKVQGPSNRHYRLLTRLALETGARLQEMVLANWSEFDLKRSTWTIPAEHVKTGFGRFTPLTKRALRTLRALLSMRDATTSRVFHLLGKPASVSSVFARIVKRACVVDYHFHDLRHDAISRLVLKQRNLTVDMIMTMVGHSSLAMLRRYTNLRPEELVARLM